MRDAFDCLSSSKSNCLFKLLLLGELLEDFFSRFHVGSDPFPPQLEEALKSICKGNI
jgi:hypothetical protein